MLVGYARISSGDQSLNLQEDALKKVGCEKLFTDIASGAKTERNGLQEALKYLRENDILVVWKLDRLGRSLKHLIEVVSALEKRKIGFKSLSENIDTTSPGGRLIFHVFGALAEFERELIRERTKAGLNAARERGHFGGRKLLMDEKKITTAKALLQNSNLSIKDICHQLKISKATLYRHLPGKHGQQLVNKEGI